MVVLLLTLEGVRFIAQVGETVVLEKRDLVVALQLLMLPFRPELSPR